MNRRFPNLDGLRFYAALLVMLTHVEVFKKIFGWPLLPLRLFNVSSHLAVTFFFVLSGFLITTYLLTEKKISGKIALLTFYKKRIARIWPLYYLLFILNFFVLSRLSTFHFGDIPFGSDDPFYLQKTISCFFLLPNFAELRYGDLMYMKISWSVAAEEFFYLFLPILIYKAKLSRLPVLFYRLLIFFIGLSLLLPLLTQWYTGGSSTLETAAFYSDRYRLYAFASGSLAAYYYVFPPVGKSMISLLKNRWVSWTSLLVFFFFTLAGITFSYVNHQAYALFFAAMLLSLCYTNISPWLLNNRGVKYLGKISYGIYMLHPIVIVLLIKTGGNFFAKQSSMAGILLFYFFVIGLTMLVCACSYEFFESRFLGWRKTTNDGVRKVEA